MRAAIRAFRPFLVLFFGLLLPQPPAFAQDPPTSPPIPKVPQGLSAATNLPTAFLSVMDRNYLAILQYGGPTILGMGPPPKRRDYLAAVEARIPATVMALAIQARSYTQGPAYISPEISLGNFQAALDVAYQHYEGDLHGDGVSLRYSPTSQASAYHQRLAEVAAQITHIRRLAAGFDHRLYGDVLMMKYGDGPIKEPMKPDAAIDKLDQAIKKLDRIVQGDPTKINDGLGNLAGKLNLATAVSLTGGYRHINGGEVSSLGFSVSRLFPIRTPVKNEKTAGVSLLFSAQQALVQLGPGRRTALVQYGLNVAWQDKVASPENPAHRWDTQIGAEYIVQTSLDQSPTYGLFLRYRPYGHYLSGEKAKEYPDRDYAPMDFSLFAGIGPNGKPFLGARASLGFSL